ncbi:MAG: hypothetical protein ACOC1X_02250 [Promethearchaeota archaeon]
MGEKDWFKLLLIVMIFVVMATCVYLYIFLKSNAKSCMEDPIGWAENQKDASCYCYSKSGEIIDEKMENGEGNYTIPPKKTS